MLPIVWNPTFKKTHDRTQKKRVFDTWAEFAYLPDMMLSAVHKKRKVGASLYHNLAQTFGGARLRRGSALKGDHTQQYTQAELFQT